MTPGALVSWNAWGCAHKTSYNHCKGRGALTKQGSFKISLYLILSNIKLKKFERGLVVTDPEAIFLAVCDPSMNEL